MFLFYTVLRNKVLQNSLDIDTLGEENVSWRVDLVL